MDKVRILLIVPYFGKFPLTFDFFLKSLSFNSGIDLLLITDQEVIEKPANLLIKHCSFDELRNKIQSKFHFKISLDKPYKLCDYKPAYGYIFEEEISGYNFWGHCDIDMVLGDILKFLPNSILNTYDKIYQLGHLCLYRNSYENNRRFMLDAGMNYQDVFTTNLNCLFDEGPGIQNKYNCLKIPTYLASDCADISPNHNKFIRVDYSKEYKKGFNYRHQVFFWENGRVLRAYLLKEKIQYDEFNYIHVQKRTMTPNIKNINACNSFFITPKGYIPKNELEVTKETLLKMECFSIIKEIRAFFDYFHKRIKNKLNKIKIIKKEKLLKNQ